MKKKIFFTLSIMLLTNNCTLLQAADLPKLPIFDNLYCTLLPVADFERLPILVNRQGLYYVNGILYSIHIGGAFEKPPKDYKKSFDPNGIKIFEWEREGAKLSVCIVPNGCVHFLTYNNNNTTLILVNKHPGVVCKTCEINFPSANLPKLPILDNLHCTLLPVADFQKLPTFLKLQGLYDVNGILYSIHMGGAFEKPPKDYKKSSGPNGIKIFEWEREDNATLSVCVGPNGCVHFLTYNNNKTLTLVNKHPGVVCKTCKKNFLS